MELQSMEEERTIKVEPSKSRYQCCHYLWAAMHMQFILNIESACKTHSTLVLTLFHEYATRLRDKYSLQ